MNIPRKNISVKYRISKIATTHTTEKYHTRPHRRNTPLLADPIDGHKDKMRSWFSNIKRYIEFQTKLNDMSCVDRKIMNYDLFNGFNNSQTSRQFGLIFESIFWPKYNNCLNNYKLNSDLNIKLWLKTNTRHLLIGFLVNV